MLLFSVFFFAGFAVASLTVSVNHSFSHPVHSPPYSACFCNASWEPKEMESDPDEEVIYSTLVTFTSVPPWLCFSGDLAVQ
jgi:hypothetical protein